MKESNFIKMENYAPQLFDIGWLGVNLNSRNILVRFYEGPEAFHIKYYEASVGGKLKELGGAIGATQNDTFLSLDNAVKFTVVKSLRERMDIFSVK